MPVIVQNYCTANAQQMESFADEEFPVPNISISELLFPAFNSLVPQFFEHILPFLSKLKNTQDMNILISAIHQLLGFAFKTQVFDKIICRQIQALMTG
jgi:hypothetical protein